MMDIIKKIYEFFGGLFKRSSNKDLINDNQVCDIKNFYLTSQGFWKKRPGRSFIFSANSGSNVTGLIQNETSGGTRELFAIASGQVYYDDGDGTGSSKLSGLTDGEFHSEYWQNQVFWGNGTEDILTQKTIDDSFYNIYMADMNLGVLQIFSKDDFSFKDYINVDQGLIFDIEVDSSKIYVQCGSTDVVYDKKTLVQLSTATFSGRMMTQDGEFLYTAGNTATNVDLYKYSKSDYSQQANNSSGDGAKPNGIWCDEAYLYVIDDSEDITRYNKTDLSKVDTLASNIVTDSGGLLAYKKGFTGDESYLYVADYNNDTISVVNKSTGAVETTFGSSGTGDGEFSLIGGMDVDDDYIWVTDFTNNNIQYFDKSTYSYAGKLDTAGPEIRKLDRPGPIRVSGETFLEDFYGHLGAPLKPAVSVDYPGGNPNGTYTYKITFSDGTNESTASPESDSVSPSSEKVLIELRDKNYGDDITHWRIYRKASGGNYERLTEVAIGTKYYIDDSTDASIDDNVCYPANSTLYDFLDSSIFTIHQERLWVADGTTVYWSDSFKPYYFPSDNYLQVSTRDDITGLKALNDDLYIFTTNNVYVLRGYHTDSYTCDMVSESTGCIAHRSIQTWNDLMVFLDSDGWWLTNGQEPVKISDPAVQEFSDDIQEDKWKYICSAVWKDKYFCSIPVSSGNSYNDKTVVYDFIRKVWYVFEDWNIQSYAVVDDSNGNPLLYGGDNDSGIYQLWTGTADDDSSDTATDISCSVETKHYDLGEPSFKKNVRRFIVSTGNDGSNNVTATFKWVVGDNSEESTTDTITKARQFTYIRPAGGWGNNFYLKIEESSQYDFSVFGFEADIRVVGKRRYD